VTKSKPHHYHDWPRRDEVRATDPPPSGRHRSRKNRRRWCRGKVGVDHVLDVRVSRLAVYRTERGWPTPTCYRAEWWPTRWRCQHERYCVSCGKILDHTLGDDCPDLTTEVTWFRDRTT
jgi:hypothetical protein